MVDIQRRVSHSIKGLMLSHAYMVAKRDAVKLNVVSIDGECVNAKPRNDRINVHVSKGIVKRSWVL